MYFHSIKELVCHFICMCMLQHYDIVVNIRPTLTSGLHSWPCSVWLTLPDLITIDQCVSNIATVGSSVHECCPSEGDSSIVWAKQGTTVHSYKKREELSICDRIWEKGQLRIPAIYGARDISVFSDTTTHRQAANIYLVWNQIPTP